MTSHELAKALLRLADKPVELISPVGNEGTQSFSPSIPWEDMLGSVRIQIMSPIERYAECEPKERRDVE